MYSFCQTSQLHPEEVSGNLSALSAEVNMWITKCAVMVLFTIISQLYNKYAYNGI